LAPQSVSTLANCGEHEVRKNNSTQAGGAEHEQRVADGVAEPRLQRASWPRFRSVGEHFEHLIERT